MRTLLERQAQGQEAAAHQHADLVKALSGLAGALEEQQARQEARHQQLLDLLTRLLEQQQGQGQQEAAAQRQEGQVLRQQPDAVPRQAAQEAQPQVVAAVAPAASLSRQAAQEAQPQVVTAVAPVKSEVVVRPEKEDKQQELIGLLDYVRIVEDLDDDTMSNGAEGVVLGLEGDRHPDESCWDTRLKVGARTRACKDIQFARVRCCLPCGALGFAAEGLLQ